jgi:SulP family sulfate permease
MTRFLPFLQWWHQVNATTLRADALAGLVGAIAVVPQGVAFATLAGLPPEYGLYCAMLPTIVAALFGSSLHAVSGPTNAVSLMVFAVLVPLATPGTPQYIQLALTLALMCGVIMIALGLARMGALVNFMSDAVIVGFTAAIGVLIVATQLHVVLGINIPPTSSFIGLVAETWVRLGDTRPWVVLTAAITVAAGVASRRWLRRVPAIFTATLVGSVAGAALQAWLGAERSGITMLGSLSGSLPPLSLPDLSPATLQSLAGGAVAVTVLALTQAISISRAVALRSGQRLDNDQEFIGQGLANVAAAFFSGFPSSASVNRCGINYEAGARTPLAAVMSAGFLVVLLLTLGWLTAWLPLATVAGVLMFVAWNLVDRAYIRRTLATSRDDAIVLALTFAATLLLDLAIAILAGVAASLVMYLYRSSHPSLRSLVPSPHHADRRMAEVESGLRECPQAKILRIEGSIYFGAVNHVEDYFDTLRKEHPEQKHLLLMSKSINTIDMAGADLIGREAIRRNADGGGVYLYSPRKPVIAMLHQGGTMKNIGTGHVFRSKHEAFSGVVARLDYSICATCTARIFTECRALPGAPHATATPE